MLTHYYSVRLDFSLISVQVEGISRLLHLIAAEMALVKEITLQDSHTEHIPRIIAS